MRQRGDELRRLLRGEARRRHAEVGATGGIHAPDPRPPFGAAQIQLEDPVLREGELEAHGRRRLLHLAERVTRGREVEVLGELLGDRARAAPAVAAVPRRGDRRPKPVRPARPECVDDLRRIDPVMRTKTGILTDDDHALEGGGDVLQGGRLERRNVGTFQPSSVPTFGLAHQRRRARPVIAPPHRRRPDGKQPHQRGHEHP